MPHSLYSVSTGANTNASIARNTVFIPFNILYHSRHTLTQMITNGKTKTHLTRSKMCEYAEYNNKRTGKVISLVRKMRVYPLYPITYNDDDDTNEEDIVCVLCLAHDIRYANICIVLPCLYTIYWSNSERRTHIHTTSHIQIRMISFEILYRFYFLQVNTSYTNNNNNNNDDNNNEMVKPALKHSVLILALLFSSTNKKHTPYSWQRLH